MKINVLMIFIIFLMAPILLHAAGNKETAEPITLKEAVDQELNALAVSNSDRTELSDEEMSYTVTVEDAVRLAEQNNLGILSEEISLKMKERAKKTVWNRFYPTITASGSFSRLHVAPDNITGAEYANSLEYEGYSLLGVTGAENPFENPLDPTDDVIVSAIPEDMDGVLYDYIIPYEIEVPHTWILSAGVNMNLTLTAALLYGIKHTIIDYSAGSLSLETAKLELAKNVKKTFYNLLLLKENIKLMKQKIVSAEKRYEQAKINFEYGLVDEYTMLSAQVGLENIKPGLTALNMAYDTALMNFKFLLGLPLDSGLSLKGSIEPEVVVLNAEELVKEYARDRLDIQSLIKQIEIVKNGKKATIAGMTPALTFMLSFDPTFMQDPFEELWFKDMSDNWSQRSGMFGVTVSVSLDQLLPFSRSWVDIANAEDSIRQLRTALSQAVQGAEMEIAIIVKNLQQTQKLFETLNLNVDLAQRAYSLAEEAYNAGGRALIDVEDAEDKLQEARFEVLKEQFNYISYLLDLEYALNTPLEEITEE